jgi:hypothetical protein
LQQDEKKVVPFNGKENEDSNNKISLRREQFFQRGNPAQNPDFTDPNMIIGTEQESDPSISYDQSESHNYDRLKSTR